MRQPDPRTRRLATKAFKGATLALLMLLSVACSEQEPRSVYIDMTTAAQMGDRDGFMAGFTKESKALVEALITLSEAYGMRNANPYELLVFDAIEEQTIAENGKTAVLLVRTGGKKRKILMVYDEEDGWRIDTKRLEEFWKEEGRSWN